MSYNPCEFDRNDYLDRAASFESVSIGDAENIAIELAYTRYTLAKAEKALSELQSDLVGAQEDR